MLTVLSAQGMGIQRSVAEEATEYYSWDTNTIVWVTTSVVTAEWYTENTYTVDITLKAQQFGNNVDRLYDIYLWAKIGTAAHIDEQGPKGPYQLLDEGDTKTIGKHALSCLYIIGKIRKP